MNKITFAGFFLLSAVSHISHAVQDKPYHHESQIDYISSSEDFSNGKWALQYRYFQEAVNQETVPYALSGFLAQTSNIGGQYVGFGDDDTRYDIDGTYVFDSKWFIGLGYQKTDINDASHLALINRYNTLGTDSKTYAITGGYYLNKSTEIYLAYQYNDGEQSSTAYHTDMTGHYYRLGLRTLVPMTVTEGIYIDASYQYADTELQYSGAYTGKTTQNSNNFNLTADWYFTPSWSVGGYYHTDDSNSDNDDYGIGTAYFLRLNDVLSARINVVKQFEPDLDGVYGNLSVNARF
ncbi:hypothetical protein [uncultured Shewanella sp.]|uniref:hypothetical protein n=1 Tax=uncultured Shewanella sp. TaxID=173975 RepID=UPI0026024B2B|nr:hypothetical protein [uncultured Shewanella sp.]